MRRRWWIVGLGLALALGAWRADIRAPVGAPPSPPPGDAARTPSGRATPASADRPARALPEATADRAEPAEPTPPDDAAPDEDEVRRALVAAESAFDEGDLAGARDGFRWVVEEAPDSAMAPFAAYKLAWVEYDGGNRAAAVRELQRAGDWLGERDPSSPLAQAIADDLGRMRSEPAGR